jgi:hypothetical protein
MRRPPSPKKDYAASERPGMRHPKTCHYPKECPKATQWNLKPIRKEEETMQRGIEKETEN